MHNIKTTGKDVELSPLEFFKQQVLLAQPFTAPIWLSGLGALFFWKPLKPYRFLGWCYVVTFTMFVVLKGKNYYMAPIYPMMYAAGAVVVTAGIDHIRQGWLKPAIAVLLIA